MSDFSVRLPKALIVAGVLAAASAGCVKTEAERFGYKGEDLLDPTNLTFLVLSPTVTNWVPERVLSVVEKYDFTEAELAVLKAAGVLMPGEDYAEIGAGYSKSADEPWFVCWTKPAESFGLKGVVGILSHYDEDARVWQTSESYFSSYWPTREDALDALAKIEAELAAKHQVKKFHRFDGCWVAEYVRLCVMGVVGQKADGQWSCMLDFRDKGRVGCGVWEPVEEQRNRRSLYEYGKAMRQWKQAVKVVVETNRAAVAKAAAEKGLTGFPEARSDGRETPEGMPVLGLFGSAEPETTEVALKASFEKLWADRVDAVAKALGVSVSEEIAKQDFENQGREWSVVFDGDLYQGRLDVAMPGLPSVGAPAEGEPAETPALSCLWRILFVEKLQPGFTLPTRPQLAK